MKHQILFLIAFIYSINLYGQTEYLINDFSDKFYAKILIDTNWNENLNKQGDIIIIRKEDNKEIIEQFFQDSYIRFFQEAKSDSTGLIMSINQNDVLDYVDANFDGKKDLKILDRNGNNHYFYSVYINRDSTFVFDSLFSEANSYFDREVDSINKTIYTSNHNGYNFSGTTFKIKDGAVISFVKTRSETSYFLPFVEIITTEIFENEKSNKSFERIINTDFYDERKNTILSFKLIDSKKNVLLYSIDNHRLYFILTKDDRIIEFYYPNDEVSKEQDFQISKSANELSFISNGAKYTVFQDSNSTKVESIGLIINRNGENFEYKGDANSLKGNLNDIPKLINTKFE